MNGGAPGKPPRFMDAERINADRKKAKRPSLSLPRCPFASSSDCRINGPAFLSPNARLRSVSSILSQAQLLLDNLPSEAHWRGVVAEMNAHYIFHGALVYVLMQPILKKIFQNRSLYTGALRCVGDDGRYFPLTARRPAPQTTSSRGRRS